MKKEKKLLVFLDRDGTIIHDNKYHLGHQKNWKKLVKILPNVVNGIKKLNKLGAHIYIITNLPGIAIKEFKLYTPKKANEVCKYVIKQLKKKGANVKGYVLCPHANLEYVKKHPQYTFNKKYIHKNCPCFKPHTGMIKKALKKEKNSNIYVIGDRASDVKTGINAKGHGILVPFKNRKEEPKKVKKIKSKRKYIAKNFLDAVKFIETNSK